MGDGSFTVKVEGLAELEELLGGLAQKEARTALRRGMRKAIGPVKNAIVANAPRDTGFMDEHFIIKSKAGGGDSDDGSTGSIVVTVQPTNDTYPETGKVKRQRRVAEVVGITVAGSAHEAARPFITEAYEQTKDQVVSDVITEVTKAVENINKKR
jgi:HK97 gp10 family phage protein